MLTQLVGGVNLERGDEHEFEDAEAQRLIAAGFAEPLSAPRPRRETAIRRTPKKEMRG